MHTANDFRGRAIGAAFFAGFGALWLALSLYVRGLWTTDRAILIATGAALLLAACRYLSEQAKLWTNIPEDPARNRAFHRINIAQWVVIGILSPAFSHYHLDAYICSAITAVVGIHLFPLAKLFRRPQHRINGIVLTLWASFTVLAVPIDQMQGVTALGTGTILWTSAAISLATGILSAKRSPKENGPNTSVQAA